MTWVLQSLLLFICLTTVGLKVSEILLLETNLPFWVNALTGWFIANITVGGLAWSFYVRGKKAGS